MTDDDLLHLVYATASDLARWPELLDALRLRFGCVATILFDLTSVSDGRTLDVNASVGYPDKTFSDYRAYFRHHDIRVRRTAPTAAPGYVYLDDRDIAFQELERTEIQHDFYRPNGVGHIGGFVLAKQPAGVSVLSLHRASRYGPFSSDEATLLDLLSPHIMRAREIARSIGRFSNDTLALGHAIDALQAAVFLVDVSGKIRRASREAERIARANTVLRVRNSRIELVNPPDDNALKRMLSDVVAVPSMDLAPEPATLRLTGQDGAVVLTLLLVPVRVEQIGGKPLILIFANDPRTRRPSDPALIARQFGLSRAEARVVVALADGLTVAELSARFGVSAETIRTHLKHAMAKCDVRSQVGLVRLVLGSLGGLAPSL